MDYSLLRYDISQKEPLCRVYPELEVYDAFKGSANDKLLRFTILLCDDNSPLKRESDFGKKVELAMNEAGITIVSVRESIMEWGDSEVSKKISEMVLQYLILQNNHLYTLWLSKLINFHFLNKRLREAPKGDLTKDIKSRLDIDKMMDEIVSGLQSYEKQLFPDNNIKRIAAKEVMRITNWSEKLAERGGVI